MGPRVVARRGTINLHNCNSELTYSDFQFSTTMVSRKTKQQRRNGGQAPDQSIARLRGKGGYYSDRMLPILRQLFPDGSFARAGETAGGILGSVAGGSLGPAGMGPGRQLGGKLGSNLGSRISRLVGFGDYTVKENSLFKEGMAIPPGEAVPSFGVLGQATRVRHREYIRDIVVPASPMAFTNTSYVVNPGLASSFPWLAALANQYQQYKFNGLVFEFKTLSSDITSGGALGSVVMASNYDVVAAPFASKIEMENSQYAVSAKPSCSQIHTMECLPSATANVLYYVRNNSTAESLGQDNRFYDLANFQLATAGLPGSAGTVLGELWVSYDVSLYKPVIHSDALSTFIVSNASISKTNFFGNSPVVKGNGITAANNTLTFSQTGDYLVTMYYIGTGLNVGLNYTGTAGNFSQIASSFASGSTTLVTVSIEVDVTQPGQTLVIDATGTGTVTGGDTLVSLWNADLV